MVYFICNNCGDSLKKPQVDQHLGKAGKFSRCKNCSVSCMDCHRDFDANSYVHHTKCITEAEKYSGGNFKPKASTVNKQDKQGRWLELIQTVAQRRDFKRTTAVQDVLDFLAAHQAVPNKEKAYWNFMKTVPHQLRNSNVASIVWDLLMKERATVDSKPALQNSQQNGKSNGQQKSPEKVVQEVVEEEALPAKKVVKTPETWKQAIERLSQGGGPFADTFEILSKLDDVPTESKQMFKTYVKRKVPEVTNTAALWKTLSTELQTGPKMQASKKGKRKAAKAAEKEDKLNKKIKLNDDIEEAAAVTPTKGGKFPWKKIVVQALTESKDHSMGTKKLLRKVMKEYQSSGIVSAESSLSKEQLEARLTKTIGKLPNVITKNDAVVLITGDNK